MSNLTREEVLAAARRAWEYPRGRGECYLALPPRRGITDVNKAEEMLLADPGLERFG